MERHAGESNPFQLIDNQPAIPIASRGMTVHRAGFEPAFALIERLHCRCTIGRYGIRVTLPAVALCRRARCLAVPAWSRRLESNQPNVLYPKQAAHLAPPPR